MNIDILKATAKQMVAPGKGIIAADESNATCEKRFTAANIPCTEETRRAYRDLIISADGLEQYISGIILFDETIRQNASDGTPFPQVLIKKGIIPGIKVDKGLKDLDGHPEEKVTEGLGGLPERLAEYAKIGAKFAKWRAVITIGANIPSANCINANAERLAKYSKACQEADIVPMIEPEVLIDGDHTIEQCCRATEETLKTVFAALAKENVPLEGVILKTSMVIAGKKAAKQSTVQEVADATMKCLKANVPASLAGVVFLSGGQTEEQSTAHLNAMNKMGPLPWPLSFSYARAIQNPVLKIWAADMNANVAKAREVLLFRSKMNSLAARGTYSADNEKQRPY